MYLLDTNVISELRRPKPHGAVVAWIKSAADIDLHISVVTLGEIQAGIEITRDQNPEKAKEIENWADQLAESYNIVTMDADCFRQCARLMHGASDTLYEDAMIASTALVHRLTVVTRNVRDFMQFKVPVLDPFK